MRKLDPLEILRRQRPESEAVRAIVEYLLLVPTTHVYRVREIAGADGRYHQGAFRGCPDLCGWVELPPEHREVGTTAVPLFIEVKRSGPKAVRRGEQRAFIALAQQTGCIALFADGVEPVREELRRWGVRCP